MSEQIKTESVKEDKKVVLVQGQLTKIIYVQGQGQYPKKGQEISALYKGTLQNGQQFDSNQDRQRPFKFTLGEGGVIKGWDEGFASMKIGQKARLICSPDYAYGAKGSPPKIPPNSTLNFDVQLIDFHDKKKQKWDLNDQQKIQQATKCKNQGNQFLKNGKISKAIQKYQQGLEFVDTSGDDNGKKILKLLRMNLSQAYLSGKQYAKAIESCTKVLKDDADNIKTLYRRGVAYTNNQDFDLAKTDIEKLLKLDPQNNDAKQELKKIIQGKKLSVQNEKKFFGGMFSQPGIYEDMKPQKKQKKKKKQSKPKDLTDSSDQDPPKKKKQQKMEPEKPHQEKKP